MPRVASDFRITEPLAYYGDSNRPPADTPRTRRNARSRAAEARIAFTDPALHVVTDFVWEQPVTAPQDLSIDDALREMIRAEVRALLVVRDDQVTGLLTSYDIQGERPLQFLSRSGYRRHDEIEVGHIDRKSVV